MADNVTLNAGSGGSVLAADDISSVFYQRVKVTYGTDGSATDVSDTNPMPIDDAGGSLTVDNGGTFVCQIDGAALTSLQLIDDSVYTDGSGTPSKGLAVMGTDGTNPQIISVDTSGNVQVDLVTADVTNAGTFAVQVDAALPAGTNEIGKLAANSGVDIGDVDILSIAAGTNVIGQVNAAPQTTGGLTIFRSIDLDESEEEVKATAGQLYGYHIFNDHATAIRYLKFYNATAATVVVGTTVPVMTIPIVAQSGANVEFTNGIAFGTAITVAATTGVADADTGAPGANEIIVNLFYK